MTTTSLSTTPSSQPSGFFIVSHGDSKSTRTLQNHVAALLGVRDLQSSNQPSEATRHTGPIGPYLMRPSVVQHLSTIQFPTSHSLLHTASTNSAFANVPYSASSYSIVTESEILTFMSFSSQQQSDSQQPSVRCRKTYLLTWTSRRVQRWPSPSPVR